MELTSSQVRQDFSCFGGFGQQGYGYRVETLRTAMAGILGLGHNYRAVVVGTGNVGRALLSNFDFERHGFDLLCAFDSDPAVIGVAVGGFDVRDAGELELFIKDNQVDMAVIAVPPRVAEEVAARLAGAGVTALWNFAPVDLDTRFPGVHVENVNLADSVMTLCYRLTNR